MSTEAENAYLGFFEGSADARSGEPAALAELRRGAIERFAELGFPTTRDEEWRHTNVGPLARASFVLADSHNSVGSSEAGEFMYEGCDHLVFVNGRYSSELSSVGELAAGVVVGSLRELRSNGIDLEAHLGRYASFDKHAFVALNTALHDDGAVVLLPRGVVLERPVQWVYLSTGDMAQKAVFPRNLVVAGENSQLTIVESYVGLTDEAYFNCAVTEIVGEAHSVVQHYKVQKEGMGAFHLATQQAHLGRSATLTSLSITEGGKFVRNDVNAMLAAEGVDCALNGLYVLTDRQFVDNHMHVEHAKPHCDSHELYKGILDGHSRAVFSGLIYVHPGAQKTDAKQTNRNLLLSDNALVNSHPQLEIFADDVKCTHGSTVGQLDEDAVFYLRSRGIDLDAARSLLTWAFASELVDTIRVEAVRADVERLMFSRLTSSDVVRDAI